MLTCPHCLHSFAGPAAPTATTTTTTSPPSAAPACCCAGAASSAAPVAVRVFAGSGGGLVVSEGKPTCSGGAPHLQVSFQQPPSGLQVSFSPSVQIVLPSWPVPHPVASPWSSANLSSTHKALVTSGWYYEALSGEESLVALKNCPPGTFLVRDSSDPEHLFSLSVQTTRGPTSVRLHYLNGEFRLDAQHHLAHHVPRFACVLQLIEHYVREGRRRRPSSTQRTYVNVTPTPEPGSHVWVDDQGRTHSPILLTRPLRRRVSNLQHLARLAINQRLQHRDLAALDLPTAIEDYLREYPYTQ